MTSPVAHSTPAWRARLGALALRLMRLRYAKFGVVGAGGTVVNMLVLMLGQEVLFLHIEPARTRLYASLALAILLATLNNFSWNRLWTWADRQAQARPWAAQFGRYALASWLGSAMQYALTLWLAHAMHYLLANVLAIGLASVSNYLANDLWTFRRSAPPTTGSTPSSAPPSPPPLTPAGTERPL